MPPIARTVALVLIAMGPVVAVAQTPAGDAATTPLWSSTSANRAIEAPSGYSTPATPSQTVDRIAADANRKSAPDLSPSAAKGSVAVPLSPPRQGQNLPLPARNEKGNSRVSHSGLNMLLTTGGALAFVIGLIFVVAWGFRRAAPRGAFLLPGEVVEVLGRAPLANRQMVHLLRCGNKLLLVSVTPTGADTLTEITDPMEVDRVAGLCRQAQPGSSTTAFRQMLQQFSHDGDHSGLADDAPDSRGGRRRGAWEDTNA